VPSRVGPLAPSGEHDWTCASFGPPEFTTQTANQLVQLLLHSSWQSVVGYYTGATCRIRSNFFFLRPTRIHNPNGKSIGSAAPYFTKGKHVSQNYLSLWGIWTPSNPWFFRPILVHNPNDIRFSHFCTDDCRVSLYFGTPFSPSKLPLPTGRSGPPSNTWFLGPTRVLNPNGISIGSATFAGLIGVTDRPTDHATQSVTIGRIYVRSMGDAV